MGCMRVARVYEYIAINPILVKLVRDQAELSLRLKKNAVSLGVSLTT